jgi:hypothetical protein
MIEGRRRFALPAFFDSDRERKTPFFRIFTASLAE